MIPICPSIFVLMTFFIHLNHNEVKDNYCFMFECDKPIGLSMVQGNAICKYRDPKNEEHSFIETGKKMNDASIECHMLDFTRKNLRRYVNLTKGKNAETFFCLDSYYDAPVGLIHRECKTPQKTQEKLLRIVKQFEDFQRQEEKKHFNNNLFDANQHSKKNTR